MNFLMSHNFDFNKLFYEGLEYISREDRLLLQESVGTRKIKDDLRADSIARDKQYKAFKSLHWENVVKELERLCESEIGTGEEEAEELTDVEVEVVIRFVKVKIYKYFEAMIEKEFEGRLKIEFEYDSDLMPRRTVMTVKARKVEEKAENEENEGLEFSDQKEENVEIEENSDSENEDQDDNMAFMDVIDLIINEKKPLLVHNGIFDIFHFYHKFIGTLPEQHSEFKKKWIEHVPEVYDTKFMLNNSNQLFSHTNKHTSLGDSFDEVSGLQNPEIKLAEGFENYDLDSDGASHEAGFDAYMTGVIFLRNLYKLGKS